MLQLTELAGTHIKVHTLGSHIFQVSFLNKTPKKLINVFPIQFQNSEQHSVMELIGFLLWVVTGCTREG